MFIIITAIKNEIPINDDTLSCIRWKIWTKWVRTLYHLLIETEVQDVEKKKKRNSIIQFYHINFYLFIYLPDALWVFLKWKTTFKRRICVAPEKIERTRYGSTGCVKRRDSSKYFEKSLKLWGSFCFLKMMMN